MLCEHRLLIAQVVCDEPSDDNSSKAAARAEQTKTPDLSPGLCKLEAASLLKMKSQTALEDMELKVSPGARRRIKTTEAGAARRRKRQKGRARHAGVAKIDIQIGEVQHPVL